MTNGVLRITINARCSSYPDDSKATLIFMAEERGENILKTEWKSFDTLKVIYSEHLVPLTQVYKLTFQDSSLDLNIQYEVK